MVLWSTVDPTHLAGRLDINIHPLVVLTAVSYRLGDDVTVGGRFVRSGGPRRCCRRVVRREPVVLWSAVDPTHLAGDYFPASSECGDVHNEEDSSSTPSEMAGAFVWRPGCVPPPEVCNYRVRPVVGTQLPDLCRAVACVRLKRGLRPLRFL